MVFTCKEGFYYNEIPFDQFANSNLTQITSFSARGYNGARGPMISIPNNICSLPNLQILDLSFNRINSSEFIIPTTCSLFHTLQTFDLSSNYLTTFPSNFTSQISSLQNVYMHSNQLQDIPIVSFYNVEYLQRLNFSYNNLTSFELWTFLVQISVDYSYNQISKITNNGNYNMSRKTTAGTRINLTNNELIYLNDGIYEMYDTCSEVHYWLEFTNQSQVAPLFTLGLYTIDFGSSLIDCSCDSFYIRELIPLVSGGARIVSDYPFANATCSDGRTKFVEFNNTNCLTSTTNFSALTPRFCKINESENGTIPTYLPGQNYTQQTTTSIPGTTTLPTIINTTSVCSLSLTVSGTTLVINCPSTANLSLLPINSYSFTQLNEITKLTVQGDAGLRGPLVTIPPNICFLPRLTYLNISFNRITSLDSSLFSSNSFCLKSLTKLDLSKNFLTQFSPTYLLQISQLDELFLQSNQITSLDLSYLIRIYFRVDLSNNQITTLTNYANVNFLTYSQVSTEFNLDLTNNPSFIDFTDRIYEMYGACYEIQQLLNTSIETRSPLLTNGLLKINFNNTKINCSCEQFYIEKALETTLNNDQISNYPLSSALCTDGSLFFGNNRTRSCSNSSVDFSTTSPRLCKINSNEPGFVPMNATDNSTVISYETYPFYLTQTTNTSYCLFTFYQGGLRVSIDCINGSAIFTEISSIILANTYFLNITQVIINNQQMISSMPFFLCFLPSKFIDLSNQSFEILDQNTFPCSNNSTLQYISLAYNRIQFVNRTFNNWLMIDLTSNYLLQFPYSLFSTAVQLRAEIQQDLRLSSNNLTEFDLFFYTYSNVHIDFQSNPFSTIRNTQKRSLANQSLISNLTFSNSVKFVINDILAQDYNACQTSSFRELIQILERMETDQLTIEIECQCSSFYLKESYRLLNSSAYITDRFSCANSSNFNQTQFESLTESMCSSNIVLSTNRLCQFTSSTSTSTLSQSSDKNYLLAVVLGSVLSCVGVLLLVGVVLAAIHFKRRAAKRKEFGAEQSGNSSWINDLSAVYETELSCRL